MQISNTEEGKTQESKIKKVLFNEINLFLSVIAIVGVVITFFFRTNYSTQKQIDEIRYEFGTSTALSKQLQNIKDNDMVELKTADSRIEAALLQIQKDQIKLQTILEQHLTNSN